MKILSLIFFACALAASSTANTYIYKPITRIPKAGDIIAFTNGKQPATGSRKYLKKEDVLRFLSDGTPVVDRSKWVRAIGYSFTDIKDGVFFDSAGRAYFWSIRVDGALILETEDGESIQIILKNENGA